MEFLTQQPAVIPPAQYTYQGRLIISLTGHDSASSPSGGGLTKSLSRGSDGRRLSFGAGGGDRRTSFGASGNEDGANGSSGLRKILSRGDGSGNGTGASANGRRGSIGTDSQKMGKWEAKGTIGLIQTHIVIRLDQPLTPYGSPGQDDKPGLGDKIKGLFNRRASKDVPHEEDELAANTALNTNAGSAGQPGNFGNYAIGGGASTTSSNTVVASSTTYPTGIPSNGSNTMGHAPLDISYPSHISGQPTTYITIPLNAVSPVTDVKEYHDKRKSYNAAVVSVPVRGTFGSMVGPMLGELGRDHDQSWGRSGKIKVEFDTNSLSGKAEAEVLHHAIVQSVRAIQGDGH